MDRSSGDLVSAALETLRQVQIAVVGGTLAEWSLKLPDGQHRLVTVKPSPRPPSPSVLQRDLAGHSRQRLLYVVGSATAVLRAQAASGTVDLVEVDTGVVTIDGQGWAGGDLAKRPTKRRSRPAWGRWAVMRNLCLLDHPAEQAELALRSGIAQSAVSLALRRLEGIGRTGTGWVSLDKEQLLQTWIAEYPGVGGVSTHWYGLDAPMAQVRTASTLAADLEVDCLLSGDAAGDAYAPWRLPQKAQIYVAEVIDFTVAGFTPAPAGEATLTATLPADFTIWRSANDSSAQGRLVDPLIAYWDLAHAGGPDAIEAADMILLKIRTAWNA